MLLGSSSRFRLILLCCVVFLLCQSNGQPEGTFTYIRQTLTAPIVILHSLHWIMHSNPIGCLPVVTIKLMGPSSMVDKVVTHRTQHMPHPLSPMAHNTIIPNPDNMETIFVISSQQINFPWTTAMNLRRHPPIRGGRPVPNTAFWYCRNNGVSHLLHLLSSHSYLHDRRQSYFYVRISHLSAAIAAILLPSPRC